MWSVVINFKIFDESTVIETGFLNITHNVALGLLTVFQEQMSSSFATLMTFYVISYVLRRNTSCFQCCFVMQLKYSEFWKIILGFFASIFIYLFLFQLDLCSEMAKYLARSSTSFALWFPESFCMGSCYFSNSGAYHLGLLVDCNIGSRPDWFGCNNGWHCSSIGILFNYVLFCGNRSSQMFWKFSDLLKHVIFFGRRPKRSSPTIFKAYLMRL